MRHGMGCMDSSEGTMNKIKYEKPVLHKVKLVPSEAVLRSCKTNVSTGPTATPCYTTQGLWCFELGS